MFNALVTVIAWTCGAAYVAGLFTAVLIAQLWPMPGRVLDSCWKKYKESK
ncbi:hypothetical protein BIZ83_gp082 [Erwinia phage vB_EamM_ChrisDB]|nr:hypothetical protein BIZ83_gp082 [Erwinia phage vB_EamM_ChrisDB]ANZ48771.1 hypothetical protein CHRISDB_209 [Erwinia phage vB_EamM_ChrisDB]